MDDTERAEYESYQKSLYDQASAYESTYVIGGIEGKKRKAIGIAKKSLEQGLDLETIKIITGLTDTELVNLTKH